MRKPPTLYATPVAFFLLQLPLAASAVEFGAVELKSGLGEPLHAEIGVRAETGERLEARCFRMFPPTRRDLPALDGAGLRFEPSADGARLVVNTTTVLSEPAVLLGIEANCGGGRLWRELPVLLAPQAKTAASSRLLPSGEWIAAPGESPASLARLLYPGQAGVQRRFIAALATANPLLGIDAGGATALPAGTVLRMPDWRTFGGPAAQTEVPLPAAVPKAREPRAVERGTSDVPPRGGDRPRRTRDAADARFGLRLATTLAPAPTADERTRQMLRLEFRLLMSLHEQLAASGVATAAAGPAAVEQPLPLQPAAEPLAPTPTPAPAPALAPEPAPSAPVAGTTEPSPAVVAAAPASEAPPTVRLRQSPPPAANDSGPDWLSYAAGGAAALLLPLLFFLRRRRAGFVESSLDHAETVMIEHPPSAPPAPPLPLSVPAGEVGDGKPASRLSTPPPLPVEPEKTDVNPVMELAEIMLSFGRVQGAAQTLLEYIEANPREALQPWVKLLDIYREGNMHAEFEALAEKLHQNFNVERQQWGGGTPPVSDRAIARAMSLEELPHLCDRIVATWGTQACLDYLHQLLRDNRGGERSGFTLPVVQEVLLLIDILVSRQAAD